MRYNLKFKIKVIPFPKIRVVRKTSASTTFSRLSEFDTANRIFWEWYYFAIAALLTPLRAFAILAISVSQPLI